MEKYLELKSLPRSTRLQLSFDDEAFQPDREIGDCELEDGDMVDAKFT